MLHYIGLVVMLLASTFALASEPVSTSFWGNTAIGGHDATAYYQADMDRRSRLVKGEKRYRVSWQGADWYFASQASADKFSANPTSYVPHYNGFCANALSLGEGKVKTGGEVWEFFGDELYLFYAEGGRQRWLNGDWQAYKHVADEAWSQILLKN
ncbi:YHS domain-containing (seleno)protein [Marinomonas transparens]|uniref:YHS domain-containing protein n=1 Tax=Marinomonas transparens TaxID=2795388 RepID=A0A934JU19_9GAMM|nr:YHS domain-containing (seleno)protein [Marinomonas transparens]MBJ7537319.1 YHS domain-containing protein [Marinomonas transparens]